MNTFEELFTRRVSYILPTKNRAEYLSKILDSLKQIVKSQDELIVIDGNSTDNTRQVIEEYKDLITIFISEPDSSQDEAIYKGVLASHGKYIKLLADDDIYYPEAFKKAIQVLEEHPEIDLLLCGGTKEKNGRVWQVYIPPGVNYGQKVEDVFSGYSRCATGQFMRRRLFAKAGFITSDMISRDGEFLVRSIYLGAKVRFCRLHAFYYTYRHYDLKIPPKVNPWFDLAKRYCSRSFYWKYFLRKKLEKNLFRRRMFYLCKVLRHHIKSPAIKQFLGKKQSRAVEEPIWDGGLS